LKHHPPHNGVSAADIEQGLDTLAKIIAGRKDGRRLLPLFQRLEDELAAIRSADDVMAKVMARLSRG
jgi:hypothetical protein